MLLSGCLDRLRGRWLDTRDARLGFAQFFPHPAQHAVRDLSLLGDQFGLASLLSDPLPQFLDFEPDVALWEK